MSTTAFKEAGWEAVHSRVENIWSLQNKTLKELMAAMESEGFKKTEKQWKTKLKEWKLHKNVKSAIKTRILEEHRAAGANINPDESYTSAGVTVPGHKLLRQDQRNRRDCRRSGYDTTWPRQSLSAPAATATSVLTSATVSLPTAIGTSPVLPEPVQDHDEDERCAIMLQGVTKDIWKIRLYQSFIVMLFDFLLICSDPYESPIPADERKPYMQEQAQAFCLLFSGFKFLNVKHYQKLKLPWQARRAWERLEHTKTASIFDNDRAYEEPDVFEVYEANFRRLHESCGVRYPQKFKHSENFIKTELVLFQNTITRAYNDFEMWNTTRHHRGPFERMLPADWYRKYDSPSKFLYQLRRLIDHVTGYDIFGSSSNLDRSKLEPLYHTRVVTDLSGYCLRDRIFFTMEEMEMDDESACTEVVAVTNLSTAARLPRFPNREHAQPRLDIG